MLEKRKQRNALLKNFRQTTELARDEENALNDLGHPPKKIDPGQRFCTEVSEFTSAYVIEAGWAVRHKDLGNGRRQVLDFVLPGDLVGIEGPVQRVADHSITSVTKIVASPVPVEELETLLQAYPRLSLAFVRIGMRQMAIMGERLLSLGSRSATERLAHLIIEMWQRLGLRGLAEGQTFYMPVTQAVIAEALGLSTVHLNRCLQQLQRDGLISKNRDEIEIHKLGELVRVAQFDGAYLGLDHVLPAPSSKNATDS